MGECNSHWYVQEEEIMVATIEDLLREAENGWLDMEWYHNLPEPVAQSEEVAKDANGDVEVGDEAEERPVQSLDVPQRGFGSMMTDTTDYLSEHRRAEYKRWKTGIMKRIAKIERQDKGTAVKV